MKIRNETVAAIKQAADIVKVVSEYVTLKKKGENFIAFCPFEDWRSSDIPLFMVIPEHQIYKCFCCGNSGDSVKFVMDVVGASYEAALRNLAKKFEIQLDNHEVWTECPDCGNIFDMRMGVCDHCKKVFYL